MEVEDSVEGSDAVADGSGSPRTRVSGVLNPILERLQRIGDPVG
jgi:hypothetical protein